MKARALVISFAIGFLFTIGAGLLSNGMTDLVKNRLQNNAAMADILVQVDKG